MLDFGGKQIRVQSRGGRALTPAEKEEKALSSSSSALRVLSLVDYSPSQSSEWL